MAEPLAKTMTWDEFTKQKAQRSARTSRYAEFVANMKPKMVYNATGLYPKVKTDTLRSAIYGQAKTQKRKVQGVIRDGVLYIALADA